MTIIHSAVSAVTNNISSSSGYGEIFLTSQYAIPIFLAMVFGAAVVSSRINIPHTMILVGFGIAISFLDFAGLSIIDIKQFRIYSNLIINFVIPPLIFEAMSESKLQGI